MGGKVRKYTKAFDELTKLGAVELKIAQDAWALKRYAEARGLAVVLRGKPGGWKLYDATQLMGEVM